MCSEAGPVIRPLKEGRNTVIRPGAWLIICPGQKFKWPYRHNKVLQKWWKMLVWEGVLLWVSPLGLPLEWQLRDPLLNAAPEHLTSSCPPGEATQSCGTAGSFSQLFPHLWNGANAGA